MKLRLFVFAVALFFTLHINHAVFSQTSSTRSLAPDQPEEEESLNEELWESVKKTPYEDVLRYVASAQQAGRARAATAARAADVVLPNGWRIAPAGTQVELGRFPHEAVAYAGHVVVLNTGYYRNPEQQEISVVDPKSGQVVKVLRLTSMFPSAQAGLDGDLYISGGFDQKVYRINQNFELAREYPIKGYGAGLAIIDATHLVIAYLVANDEQGRYAEGRLAILNTATGAIEREVKAGYFPHTVHYAGGKLYVSLLGENKLQVYDARLDLLKTLVVGQTPQDVCVDGERVYVVNTGSDNVSVVNTRSDAIVSTIDTRNRGSRHGSAPTSCTVNGSRLYITEASANAVAIFDKNSGRQLGFVPAGWYPTKALVNGNRLFVLNAKGIRARRPNIDGPQPIPEKGGQQYVLTTLKGSLSMVPMNRIEANLSNWTRQVQEGSPLFNPQNLKLPIRHIFYIVRENRSYDQVLGDLGRGNGDPYLTLFGRDVTPNAHRLADEFVALDNYYADGEISVLGHSFTTSGYASPFLEWLGNAGYSGRYAGYPYGMVPAATSPTYLWDALDAKKVDYRIYGENYFLYTRGYRIITETYGADSALAKKFYAQMMALAPKADRGNAFYELAKPFYGQATTPEDALRLLEKPEFAHALSGFLTGDDSFYDALQKDAAFRRRFAEYLYRYPSNYRSWDLGYSDLDRAQAWREDFERQLKSGRVAQLHYIWLPNDHTDGTKTKFLQPLPLVAQNDAALAVILETISHSPVWKESLVLITEDDAQNGPDHVDATRTLGFAVSPYVKRGAIISDRYDQLSLLRTIELILGLDPLNLNDRLAVPMFGIFSDKPNFAPYNPVPPSKHLADADRQLYQKFRGRLQGQ
ncbi:MAG: bifunctional YncE family protein/alkaline phosphatase family protein [Pyrinomonadaceae bacterium]